MRNKCLPIVQSTYLRRPSRPKAIAVILLVMMLAGMLPIMAAPAYAAPSTEVYIGKTRLDATTPYLVEGQAKATGDINDPDCTAHFDATTATLTISGLDLKAEDYRIFNTGSRYGIFALGDLTLLLAGESTKCKDVAGVGVGVVAGSIVMVI